MSLHPEASMPQPAPELPKPQLFDYEKSGDVMLQTTAAEATGKFVDRTVPDLIKRSRELQNNFSVGQDLLTPSPEAQLSRGFDHRTIAHAKGSEVQSELSFCDFITVDKDKVSADVRTELQRKGMKMGRVGVVSEPRVEPTEEEVELAVNEKLSNYENDPRNLQMLDAKSTDENGEVVDTNMVVTKTGNISLSHRRGSRGFQMEIDATSHEIKKAQIMDSQNGESTYQTIDPNAHEVVDMFTIATDHLARAVEEHEQSNATSRQQTIQSLIA